MFLGLSFTAWAAMGCLLGIVLVSAALLWAAWRRGTQPHEPAQESARKPGPSPTRAWTREEDQLAELSHRVASLHEEEHTDPSK